MLGCRILALTDCRLTMLCGYVTSGRTLERVSRSEVIKYAGGKIYRDGSGQVG